MSNFDWDRVLSDTLDWTGREYTEWIITQVLKRSSPQIDFFLTLGPGMTGTEAWVFREHYPDLKIIGAEPQNDRYNFLKEKFPGTLLNCAVSAQECKVAGWMGHKDGRSDFWLSATGKNREYYLKEEVQCTTVDNILEGVTGQGFLWMDIEGAEFEAIRGALISLATAKIIFANIEVNFTKKDQSHYEPELLIQLLHSLNFIAVGGPNMSQKETNGWVHVDQVGITSEGHTDILFANFGYGHGIPLNYLKVMRSADK